MPLTPSVTDKNYVSEKLRRVKDPASFNNDPVKRVVDQEKLQQKAKQKRGEC